MTSSRNRAQARSIQRAYNRQAQAYEKAVNAHLQSQADAINTALQAQADAVARAAEDQQEQVWATITATMNNIRQIALAAPAYIIGEAFSEVCKVLQTLPHVSVDTPSQTPEREHADESGSGAPQITFRRAPRDLPDEG